MSKIGVLVINNNKLMSIFVFSMMYNFLSSLNSNIKIFILKIIIAIK